MTDPEIHASSASAVKADEATQIESRASRKPKNVVALIALVTAVVGFVFACSPGAILLGWILLPIAFVLAIVSFFVKERRVGMSVAALVISIVGTIVGAIVFTAFVATTFNNAFGGDVTVLPGSTDSSSSAPASNGSESNADAKLGSRENPLPLGTTVEQGDWKITINSVNFDAAKLIAAENSFNEPAPAGKVYILVNVTATYTGSDPNGSSPFITVDYVTVDGVTISTSDAIVVEPEAFDYSSALYTGAATTGNIALAVPTDTATQGVLAVQATLIGDKAFFAVK
ncbi:MAG: hypothetical protein ACKOXM_07890 [Agromyces sp.]